MIIFKSIKKLNKEVNFKADVGFVPTMGALHKGHVSLINKSQKMSKKTLVSIFVNPRQFNKKKDYIKYPRNIKKDIELLKNLKVDYVLIPKISDIYDKNQKIKKIKIINKVLCAKYRPNHFEGVINVIDQFIKKIAFKKIYLGEKDYQQYLLIKKFFERDKNIKIVLCKTERMKNGLAYSSRNKLLNKTSIKQSAILVSKIKKLFISLKRNLSNKLILKKFVSSNKHIKIEYIELRSKIDLSKNIDKNNVKIFFAFYVNGIRLIDNF